MAILIPFAILAGIITVLSPCILPVLPVVLSSSVSRGKSRPLGVITGLILSFSISTLLVSQIVALLHLPADTLRLAAVIIIGVLGLAMVIPALSGLFDAFFARLASFAPQRQGSGSGFDVGLITGASLGLVWAPCAGPILAAITTLAATQTVSFGAVLVTLAYAVGAGIPLLAITYGGRALIERIPVLARNTLNLQKAFGAVMVVTAFLIAFNVDAMVTAWVTGLVPTQWTSSLNGFESSPIVTRQISQLKNNPSAADDLPEVNAAPKQNMFKSDLPELGAASDFVDINHWINSNPLTIEDLRGKVVLVDFWTFDCINCIHTLPYVTRWYNTYADKGFVVIGVHTPEFNFEHDTKNVESAVQQYGIKYPVAQDNDYATWKAYNNEYWPAEYLIDAQGNLRYTHFGEGNYDLTEKYIRDLLQEAGNSSQRSSLAEPYDQSLSESVAAILNETELARMH